MRSDAPAMCARGAACGRSSAMAGARTLRLRSMLEHAAGKAAGKAFRDVCPASLNIFASGPSPYCGAPKESRALRSRRRSLKDMEPALEDRPMKRFCLTTGTCALIIAMGACASQGDSATSPKTANFQVTAVDSALIAVHTSADATISDVNMLNGVSTTMGWSLELAPAGVSMSFPASGPPSFTSGPGNGCTLNPADGRFDCPPQVNANGVTVIRSLAFFDASGTQMNHFDSTTASMNVQIGR